MDDRSYTAWVRACCGTVRTGIESMDKLIEMLAAAEQLEPPARARVTAEALAKLRRGTQDEHEFAAWILQKLCPADPTVLDAVVTTLPPSGHAAARLSCMLRERVGERAYAWPSVAAALHRWGLPSSPHFDALPEAGIWYLRDDAPDLGP